MGTLSEEKHQRDVQSIESWEDNGRLEGGSLASGGSQEESFDIVRASKRKMTKREQPLIDLSWALESPSYFILTYDRCG